MGAEKIRLKMIAAVTPYLEEGEEVRAVYLGQTRIPPILYLLVGPLLMMPIIQFKTFVATDRNLYVFPNKWLRTYSYSREPYKVPIGQASLEAGSMWMSADRGPKVWSAPFGPVNKRRKELIAAVHAAQAGAAPIAA